jgi:hypothetical protein
MNRPTTCWTLRSRGGWWEDVLSTGRCVFPIGPINTWSNLAYLVAGVAAVLVRPGLWSLAIAVLFGALAVASAWYHGTKTLTSARADNAAIYAIFTALLFRVFGGAPLLGVLAANALAWAFAFGPWWRSVLEPVAGALALITLIATAARGSLSLVAVSFALFLLAYVAWRADLNRKFPLPRWGHAVWHILTAAALFVLFVAAP